MQNASLRKCIKSFLRYVLVACFSYVDVNAVGRLLKVMPWQEVFALQYGGLTLGLFLRKPHVFYKMHLILRLKLIVSNVRCSVWSKMPSRIQVTC